MLHVTAVFAVPVTEVEKVWVFPSSTDAAVGDTVTFTCAATTWALTVFPVTVPAPGWRTSD